MTRPQRRSAGLHFSLGGALALNIVPDCRLVLTRLCLIR